MSWKPPIAKGIINAFDNFIEDIQKLSVISDENNFVKDTALPDEPKELLHLFHNITEDSTEDDCLKVIKLLKDFSAQSKYEIKCEKETLLKDFHNSFRIFRNLVESKVSLPFQEWKRTKKDLMHFPEIYGQLLQEFNDVQRSVEKVKSLRDKMISEEGAEDEKAKKMESASEDFKSLHPFFTVKNSEDHMERLSLLKERALQVLKDQCKDSEGKFQNATSQYLEKLRNIFEETIKTKDFIEWLEEKNHSKLEKYMFQIREECKNFSAEMEQSRNLGQIYAEKHAIYLDIERERADKEWLEKEATPVAPENDTLIAEE